MGDVEKSPRRLVCYSEPTDPLHTYSLTPPPYKHTHIQTHPTHILARSPYTHTRSLPSFKQAVLSTAGRVVVIVVTLGGLGLSMYGASHLEMGLNPNLALPSDSYLIPFFDLQQEYLQVVRPCFIVAACSAVAHDAVGACGARKGKEGKGLRLVGATVRQ